MSPLKISLEIISILMLIALAFIHRKGPKPLKSIWFILFSINVGIQIFFIVDRYQKSQTILNLENDSNIKTLKIDKLEKDIDPLQKPLASATAQVDVIISMRTDIQIPPTRHGEGGYLALVKNGQPLLMTVAQYTDAYAHGEGEVRYKLDLQMLADNSAIGKPIEILQTSDLIQIIFLPIPENSQVVKGTASVVINGNERSEFKILPQQMQGKNIFIYDVKNKFLTTQ